MTDRSRDEGPGFYISGHRTFMVLISPSRILFMMLTLSSLPAQIQLHLSTQVKPCFPWEAEPHGAHSTSD
ncbi:hypothetical protein ACRRTK_020340 [Alexandromys fortis]